MDMFWPYHFVTPSEQEKVRRRELLDLRGSYAQWSIVFMIVAIRAYQFWVQSSAQHDTESKRQRAQLLWWDRPLFAGWLETRRQYALCGIWLLWLLGLAVWNSGDGTSPSIQLSLKDIHLGTLAYKHLTDVNVQITSI